MTFLPIVERELRVAARHRGTWWVRTGAALVALVVGGWIMLIPGFRTPQNMGIILFVALAIVVNLYCLLAGVRTTTDSLSEEKREGTLGLLFLTDLKGYDIVLGKLAATSLNVVYGLLAVFPIMAIPLLLGGVAVEEFWRVTLCAVNNLFFSLCLGMFCSAISRDEMKSIGATFGLVVFFAGGLPLLGGLVSMWMDLREPAPFFFIPSPGFACFLSFDATYQQMSRMGFNHFYSSVLCVHVLAWLFLGLSCHIIPRAWQDRPESTTRVRQRRKWHTIKFGHPGQRRSLQRKMLNFNPVFWLISRDRLKPVMVWMLLAAGALLWIYGLVKHPRDWKTEEAYITSIFIAYLILVGWIGSESCKRFALDRRSGALELILSTPITVREILRGQWAALRRQFSGPMIVLVGMILLFLVAEFDDLDWVIFWMCALIIVGFDSVAIAWVGMWNGLSSGNIGRSSSSGVLLVLLLPWLLWGLLMTVLGVSGFFSRSALGMDPDWVPRFIIMARAAMSVGVDVLVGFGAWGRLVGDFRKVATRSLVRRKRGFFSRKSPRAPASPSP